jgi:hypothetical protein
VTSDVEHAESASATAAQVNQFALACRIDGARLIPAG